MAAGAVGFLWWFRQPESTPALRGRRVAEAQGCFACHGVDGIGGKANPGSRSGEVPGWDGPTMAALCLDEAEMAEWIDDGRPARLVALDGILPENPTVPMPAYRDRLSAQDRADLLAYLQVISGFGLAMSDDVYEGRMAAQRLGCFDCHGPAGIGGTPNPGSLKGYIPAWDGSDYAHLVRDEAEFREWTLDGRVARLNQNRVARYFLDGQVIQMPAYRAHISDLELNQITAYLSWLRNESTVGREAAPAELHKILGVIGGQQ
ncbi:c-type cytochrome [Actomonas aquatica]|uniref:Cytochrome c n=1 Tax=Actomonas aquatica TaxID=2866162 RepID=A0ABZ1CCC4_9BACT|nr:cytochrome c [Opitutus sp. WL0086]WRQ89209.1 cytochrome c [Opitutus sp. WL0086]